MSASSVSVSRTTKPLRQTNRNQLIPNLVQTVKGAAAFEKDTYTGVAEARAGLRGAEAQLTQSQQQVTHAVQSGDVDRLSSADAAVTRSIGTYLNLAVEAYPQLRASEQFTQLQSSLNETEDRIAAAVKSVLA